MKSDLATLEHLSYIDECLLIDATGEAKSELNRLTEKLDSEGPSELTQSLREARQYFLRDDNHKASATLSSAIRKAWDIHLKSKPKGNIRTMKFNPAQRVVLLIAAITICAMFLYPPFSIPRLNINPGYYFILSPPQTDPDGNSMSFVNTGLLLTQCFGVLLVAILAFLFFKDNE